MSTRPFNHHYVPQFLLRNFSRKKDQIFAYDKHTGRTISTHVRNIASERNFYDFNLEKYGFSLEGPLSVMEAEFKNVIIKITTSEQISGISYEDRALISCFAAIQMVRTRKHRDMLKHMMSSLKDQLIRHKLPLPEELKGENCLDIGSSVLGLSSLLGFYEFVPHFDNKDWFLMKAPPGHCFYISDCPVVLYNQNDYSPYGNLGLATPGIEIYLPLSKTLCLAMFCKTIMGKIVREWSKVLIAYFVSHRNFVTQSEKARALKDSMTNGTHLECDEQNVQYVNSLQVTFSSRFVFGALDDFELVNKMLKDNPKFKNGLLPTVG